MSDVQGGKPCHSMSDLAAPGPTVCMAGFASGHTSTKYSSGTTHGTQPHQDQARTGACASVSHGGLPPTALGDLGESNA